MPILGGDVSVTVFRLEVLNHFVCFVCIVSVVWAAWGKQRIFILAKYERAAFLISKAKRHSFFVYTFFKGILRTDSVDVFACPVKSHFYMEKSMHF